MLSVRSLILTAGLLLAAPVLAQAPSLEPMTPGTFALPPPAIPAPLVPWLPWIVDERPQLLCTAHGDGRACDWPGLLTLRIDKGGAGFSLDVYLDRAGRVALPGSREHWPQAVTVDGAPAVVEAVGPWGAAAQVTAGHHVLTGRLVWTTAPELLPVPSEIASVVLQVESRLVEPVRRDGEGRLFLQQAGQREATEVDTLTVTVARRLQDAVPLRETTRLTLRVAGRPRDVVLGRVLLAGGRPTRVTSALPVQVAPDGAVRVYARPGTHVVDVEAVHPRPELRFAVPATPAPFYDKQETWVWLPAENERSVELSGLAAVDPERTQLAPEWKGGRTYLAEPGQTLVLRETRRGETEPPPNRIDLARELWLDLDGKGLTARDQLSGELHQSWRLDVAPGHTLGRVGGVGDKSAYLITKHPQTGRPGVELREGKLALEADSRIADSLAEFSIVGWQFDAHTLRATLHLPPGWELLGARGVDQMPQTWLDSWTLFDFFFVLMLALGTARLLGWRWGLVALLGLALCHGREDAPEWLWFNALAALALVRVLPDTPQVALFHRVASWYHGLAVLLLVIALVPFARDELRLGLQPQVGQSGKGAMEDWSPRGEVTVATEDAATAAPAVPEAAMNQLAEKGSLAEPQRQVATGKKWDISARSGPGADSSYSQRKMQQIDPQAVVQTGPGVPRWRWTPWQLGWSGPVQAGHKVTLWLLSPRVNLLLAVLRVVLVVLLGLRLLDRARLRGLFSRPSVTAVLLLVPLGWSAANPALAQEFPPNEVLAQLADRLEAAQRCQGPCVVVSALDLRVDGQEVTLTADLSAQRDASWALPGPADPLHVRTVTLDGTETRALRRQAGGLLAVRVPKGHHTLTVTGRLARRNVLTLQLDPAGMPRTVRFDSREWRIDGLGPGGVPDTSLQLTRLASAATDTSVDPARAATPGEAADSGLELPPWFTVERSLELGLPWVVRTVVRRVQAERPLSVKVPILPGESVITDGIRVEGEGDARYALVPFGRDQTEVTFDGELPITPTLELRAPPAPDAEAGQPWTETWQLACSPIWRCAWSGLPPVHTRDPKDGALRPLWLPWPGETLRLAVVRPEGAPGQAVTIDRVDYVVTPGHRLLQAVLTLAIRTSQGGWQTLQLPEGAEVQSVSIGGKPRTIRPQGRSLRLPLEPGEQMVEVRWQQPWQRSTRETAPTLHLGGPATNVQVTMMLGEDRWLLWAQGPAWGPAVLFWSHLILVLLAALLLGRLRGPPLRTWQWLLLGLGLAQLPAPLGVIVVGWFVAMAWRRERGVLLTRHPALFDLTQLALAGWTLVLLGVLYGAIHQNLLGEVDMQVEGAGSSAHRLQWYLDRTDGALPAVALFSLPLLVWRLAMLAWALWLAWSLLAWLQWAWRGFGVGGLWLRLGRRHPAKADVDTTPAGSESP